MTFFEHQDAARRNTRWMLLLYALAVVAVVAAVDAVIAGIYIWAHQEFVSGATLLESMRAVPRWVYAAGALGTLALVLGASLVRLAQLREGGSQIAVMLGGRAVSPETRDPLERRLRNVVEEMAIASGVRVPRVYVMDDERGINAFAAGYDVSNVAVAVTRGTLEALNRDELQGVIGHEFSHILNGDMRLNIRMMGVLAGILLIGSIGGFIMRASSDRGGSRRDNSSGGLFAVGLALYVIGYVGLFFARLIKASISREREFLADASSVQFTRNPDGIAGALDQIRAAGGRTHIGNRYAEEASHLFFGEAVRMRLEGLFATHPPVAERIRRVSPRFLSAAYRDRRASPTADAPGEAAPAAAGADAGPAAGFAAGAAPQAGKRASDAGTDWGRSPHEAAALVGTLDRGQVDTAQRLIASLPASLTERLRQSEGAGATVLALVLAPSDAVLRTQLDAVRAAGEAGLAEAAQAIAPVVRTLGLGTRLPVLDLALPAIKLAGASHAGLLRAVEAAIHADRRVSLEEFVLLTLLRAQLAPQRKPSEVRYHSMAQARDDVALMLSLTAWAGCRRGPAAEQNFESAFRAGAALPGLPDLQPVDRQALRLDRVEAALHRLRDLAPLAKAVLIKALFAAVTADGCIRVIEFELMRMVGAVLDCPLPPSLDPLTAKLEA